MSAQTVTHLNLQRLVSPQEYATIEGATSSTLLVCRSRRHCYPLPSVKSGGRLKYRSSVDIKAFIDSRLHHGQIDGFIELYNMEPAL